MRTGAAVATDDERGTLVPFEAALTQLRAENEAARLRARVAAQPASPTPAPPEPDPACRDCRGVGYTVGVAEVGTPLSVAAMCACVAACSRCDGNGVVRVVLDGVECVGRCRCQMLPDRVRWWNAAKVPGRFAEATFASFDPARLTSPKLVMGNVRTFLDGWKPRGRGLLLHGDPGRGKTHLVIAMMRELTFSRGVACAYVDWGDLLLALKASFAGGPGVESEAAIYQRLITAPVLVLDEIGKGRATEWAQEVAENVIGRRYNAGATMIGSTNLSPRSQDMEEALGFRASSRLYEMTAFLPVLGTDQRRSIG